MAKEISKILGISGIKLDDPEELARDMAASSIGNPSKL